MAGLAGFHGAIKWTKVGSDTVNFWSDATHKLYSWKLDCTAETLEDTDFSSNGWRTFLAGLKTWSGTVDAYLDGASPIPISDVGSTGKIWLYEHCSDVSVGDIIYKGNIECTGIHPVVSVDGIETQTLDFQGTGTLVISDA